MVGKQGAGGTKKGGAYGLAPLRFTARTRNMYRVPAASRATVRNVKLIFLCRNERYEHVPAQDTALNPSPAAPTQWTASRPAEMRPLTRPCETPPHTRLC